MFRISELARQFELSRSTLLYYDRIGVLSPSCRGDNGYRLYSQDDRDLLGRICMFRQAGLGMEDIRRLLSMEEDANDQVLRKRLEEIGEEIRALYSQQLFIAKVLRVKALGEAPVDKEAWIEMLRSAGMDEAAMCRWHSEFERRSPEAHERFLRSLGISEEEIALIRQRSVAPIKP